MLLAPAAFDELPGWPDDDPTQALVALAKSCARLDGLPPGQPLQPGLARAGTVGEWRAICAAMPARPDARSARVFVEQHFQPYRASNNGETEGLFTGYFEIEVRGARQPDARFSVPLYRAPPDLVYIDLGQFAPDLRGRSIAGRVEGGRLRPYPDRAAIENGLLKDKNLELLWLDDAVDAFFLHIQGSGRVALPGGGAARVGVAAHNGQTYVALGKLLADGGKLKREDVTMQSIREWLRANPDEGRALMQRNPRYIFFREIAGDGPVGAQGAVLTPGRSLAVDRRFVPLGVPLWLDAAAPGGDAKPLRRLVVAQDVGGAILGPVRGDLFWGAGAAAADAAGHMRATGRYYLLLPRAAAN